MTCCTPPRIAGDLLHRKKCSKRAICSMLARVSVSVVIGAGVLALKVRPLIVILHLISTRLIVFVLQVHFCQVIIWLMELSLKVRKINYKTCF